MEFKNETGENAKYRLGSYKSGYDWHTIRPGNTADIPEHIGDELKLTKIHEVEEDVEEEQTIEDPEDAEDGFQKNTPEDELAEYRKELIAIKGVGKKSAKDIIDKYPTKEKLRIAVQDGKEIHNRDDIDKAVKDLFAA